MGETGISDQAVAIGHHPAALEKHDAAHRHQRRIAQRCELDQPDPIREGIQDILSDLEGQAGFSGPSGTGQGDQPVGLDLFGKVDGFGLATDKGGELGGKVVFQKNSDGQWVAVIALDREQDAALQQLTK